MENTLMKKKKGHLKGCKIRFYTPALWLAYFNQGYGITTYFKWLIAFFGLASNNVKLTLIIGFVYGLSCFLIGWAAFKYGFVKAQIEVSNQYNLFVAEMRKSINRKI